ncbi:biliverdin-producing heme oxygenase [Bradyrhizobium betae]|uniref:heme oxygenase (biliverdin-producing) n=1 Tax=Bradyrhizobium betae TaxID=244734 RepID=A0A5P6PAN6_9BRAD|nr:biliverdin-producing heme oxygenase [Bradyrhizobium betae]MCS3726707.1 heme oxygenase [Bradyrhizobium betae]QFI75335.1 biliverdin-producing heme oxygenase [Bradyrhizobium betae]
MTGLGAQGRRRLTRRSLPSTPIADATVATADVSSPPSVVTALYLRTKALHAEAERTGIIRSLLWGEASRAGYILLLRNLLPAYRAMEHGLERHRESPGIALLSRYRLERTLAIESDLAALCGERWSEEIPLLAAGEIYAKRVAHAADGDGMRLIAHTYTRYLGDLSGGQILQRLLARSLELLPSELTFYDFPHFSDLDVLKADYRKALDEAAELAPDPQSVVEEGAIAFSMNIDLSCAVEAAVLHGSATVAAVE